MYLFLSCVARFKINNIDSTLQVELISLDEAAKLLLGDAHNTSIMRSKSMFYSLKNIVLYNMKITISWLILKIS